MSENDDQQAHLDWVNRLTRIKVGGNCGQAEEVDKKELICRYKKQLFSTSPRKYHIVEPNNHAEYCPFFK